MHSGAKRCEIDVTDIEIQLWILDRAVHKMPLMPAMIPNEV